LTAGCRLFSPIVPHQSSLSRSRDKENQVGPHDQRGADDKVVKFAGVIGGKNVAQVSSSAVAPISDQLRVGVFTCGGWCCAHSRGPQTGDC
jgi:hypothetical protein